MSDFVIMLASMLVEDEKENSLEKALDTVASNTLDYWFNYLAERES